MDRRVFGAASDYWRLRLLHVDEGDSPDLEWRDDILYRRPPADELGETEAWRVEAIDLANDENITVLGAFEVREDALEALGAAEDDLVELTRAQFEERYFPSSG